MKKFFLLSVLIIFLCAMNLSAEAPFSEPSQNTEVQYRLFPTQNMWTFLKLDTSTGQIWQVQYSVKEEDGYRFECVLSNIDIAELYYKPKKIGRYTLFPTKNMYNFIMLDQIDGDVFQVQWSTESENRFVLPIKSVIPSYLESLRNPTESEAESQ